MKTVFLSVLACVGVCFGLNIPQVAFEEKSGYLALEAITDAEGMSSEIYDRTVLWIQENLEEHFEDHRTMFKGYYENEQKIEIMPTIKVEQAIGEDRKKMVPVRFKIKFWFKDEKMRVRATMLHTKRGYEVTPIEEIWLDEDQNIKPEAQQLLDQFNQKLSPILASMISEIAYPKPVYDEDAW